MRPYHPWASPAPHSTSGRSQSRPRRKDYPLCCSVCWPALPPYQPPFASGPRRLPVPWPPLAALAALVAPVALAELGALAELVALAALAASDRTPKPAAA